MASYSATREALAAYLRAGYTAHTIYPDPTDELTSEDEIGGWIEMEWQPGKKGPSGGRLGPSLTHYDTPFNYVVRIMIPRSAGGDVAAWAAAWAAADALETLLIESQVDDLTTESIQPRPYDVEDGDSHVQIDITCSGYLESTVGVGDPGALVGNWLTEDGGRWLTEDGGLWLTE